MMNLFYTLKYHKLKLNKKQFKLFSFKDELDFICIDI